jgi:hypothetical protein
MNTPEQIEIPKDFVRASNIEGERHSEKYSGQSLRDADNSGIANTSFITGARWAFRHLSPSPSIQTGPRWVKASERLPDYGDDPWGHFRLNGRKVCGNFYDKPVGKGSVVCFMVNGHNMFDDYDVSASHFDRLEWLDESAPAASQTYLKQINDNAESTEPEIIELVDKMCGQSLSPELFEKWEEVLAMLKNNRQAFKTERPEHEEPPLCSTCNGSGEGPADGTRCWRCKGSGVELPPKNKNYE